MSINLNDQEIAAVTTRFNLGRPVDIKYIQVGILNHNFFLTTSKGKFIIRCLGSGSSAVSQKREFAFLSNHNQFPFQIPQPLKSTNDQYIERFGANHIWVYKKIWGDCPRKLNRAKVQEIARALAHIDIAMAKCKQKCKPSRTFDLKWLVKYYDKLATIKPKTKTDLFFLKHLPMYRKLAKHISSIRCSLPMQWVHSDVHKSNVLFIGDKLTGIIDFENMCYSPRIADVAYTIGEVGMRKSKFSKRNMTVFLEAYESINPLTINEKKYILYDILRDYVTTYWWFYARMVKSRHMTYNFLNSTFAKTKEIMRLLELDY